MTIGYFIITLLAIVIITLLITYMILRITNSDWK